MNFLKINFVVILFLLLLVALPFISFAQGDPVVGTTPILNNKITNPIPNVPTVQKFIEVFLQGVLKIGFPVVAFALIYCGFLFVKAQGKPEELTKAKDALLYTLIGAAILLGSWAIAILIADTVLTL